MTALAKLAETHPIKQGMRGVVVSELQHALIRLGYPLTGTGYFGGVTDVAVEDFQRKAGLAVDGVVGRATGKAIDVAMGALETGAKPTPIAAAEFARPLWLTVSLSNLGLQNRTKL